MKLIKIYLIGLVLLGVNSTAMAANAWVNAKVVRYGPAPVSFTFVIDRNAAGASSCPSGFRFVESNPSYKIYIANLLTAAAAGKTVQIQYDNASTDCYNEVIQFQIVN